MLYSVKTCIVLNYAALITKKSEEQRQCISVKPIYKPPHDMNYAE